MHLMQWNQSFYSSNNSRGIGSLHSFALDILFICACAHYFVRWTHFSLSSSSSDFSWLSASCLMACSAEETWHCARLRVLCRPWLCRKTRCTHACLQVCVCVCAYICMCVFVCMQVCAHLHTLQTSCRPLAESPVCLNFLSIKTLSSGNCRDQCITNAEVLRCTSTKETTKS